MNGNYLSITAKLAITPWFSDEIIEEGLSLLAGGRVQFMFHRNAAGALFEGEEGAGIAASTCFEVTDRIPQGFRVTGGYCSACRRVRGRGGNCGHLAALTIAMLERRPVEGRKILPLPVDFPNNPWHFIGVFLFDQYQGRGTFQLREETSGWRLQFRHRNLLLLDCLLPEPAASQLPALFGCQLAIKDHPQPAGGKDLAELFHSLQELTLTETEAALRRNGRESRGVERDRSLYLWLARLFGRDLGPAALNVEQGGDGEFLLVAAGDAAGPALRFSLLLEREHVAGLLKSLAAYLPAVVFLPPARPFFKVEIANDGSLLITPCLRLADGRTFMRHDLAGQRYRDHYFLAGEGFLPVAPLPKECDLRPGKAGPAGLFDQVSQNAGHIPFTVANKDIPAYIVKHRQALTATENDVDPALLAEPYREHPDSLEFLAGDGDDHWFYLSGHYRVGSCRISLAELITAEQQGLSYLPGCGLKLTGTGLDWFYRLGAERLWQLNGEIKGVRLNRQELLRLTGLVGTVDVPEGCGGDRLRSLLHVESWQEPASLPECPEHLREYQRHGLAWLYHLHSYGLGGILADDMGLGKTHQALGLCWVLSRSRSGRRFLVVCPVTVAPHWAAKLENFYPELSWCLYHGQERDLARTAKINVVITTYGVLRQDGGLLADIPFEGIIFDEMQQLKNKKTAVYQAASLLTGRIKIGLTGTPLENSVQDLKALFDLCLPGALGSDKWFAGRYEIPITEENNKEKQEELARLLSSFFLRRDRRQVLKELPDIIEDIRTCELSSEQVALYREAVSRENRELIARLSDDSREVPYMEILALIGTLKQICNHPALLAGSCESESCASGKWDLFVELLSECLDAGMKVVVFSQYTRMLDIIERYLAAEDIGHCGLRGDMSLKARQKAVRLFNEDPSCRVFCASLLAGGTGIDLTAARAVVHYDRWWNAAKEDQATARVHRLGQQQVVQVFKLVTVGTLEEKIHRLIESKRDLAGQLIRADDAAVVKRLNREDLAALLRWQDS